MNRPGRLRGTAPRRWTIAMTLASAATFTAVAMLAWEQASGSIVALWLLSWALLAGAGLTWMICGPVGLARHRAYGLVAAAPVVAILGTAVLTAALPERLAWRLSENSLTAAALACAETLDDHRYGVIMTYHVHTADGACRFAIADDGGTWGLAYFPGAGPGARETRPPDAANYTPYDGRWYRYRLAFA